MSHLQLIVTLVLATLAVAAVVGAIVLTRRKTHRLTDRFGPEYAYAIEESGRRKGEAGLVAREKRVDAITIRPLSTHDRDLYLQTWRTVQSEFVDDPKFSAAHAEHLLSEVMNKRGFPTGDFEQRSEDLSVDHAGLVRNYRAVHEFALRHGRGQASTEDLRQAMILYRDLFDELVGEPGLSLGAALTAPAASAA